ncbi:hypothetical protein [Vibrio vulnificus]|uniref:hypothetical protein n=1 Tax=Vibrio vulnificus TaxID=672 RepID=UPI003ED92FA6
MPLWQSISATTTSPAQLEKACGWLNRLIWVDTFSGANAETYLKLNVKLNQSQAILPITWQYREMRYQVSEQNGHWQCEVSVSAPVSRAATAP